MKKTMKKFVAVVLVVCAMAMALTACGAVDMKKLSGEWTIQTINGKSPEDYAAELGVSVNLVNKNYTLTEKTFTFKAADGQTECPVEARSNGFNFTLMGVTGGCEYDEKADTLKYGINNDVWVLKRGSSDISVPGAAPAEGGEAAPAEGGEEGAAEGGEEGAAE